MICKVHAADNVSAAHVRVLFCCCGVDIGRAGKKCRGIVYAVRDERHACLPSDEKVKIHAHSLDFFDRPFAL